MKNTDEELRMAGWIEGESEVGREQRQDEVVIECEVDQPYDPGRCKREPLSVEPFPKHPSHSQDVLSYHLKSSLPLPDLSSQLHLLGPSLTMYPTRVFRMQPSRAFYSPAPVSAQDPDILV